METAEERLNKIWNQNKIPVVLRRGGMGQKLRVRVPYSEDNFEWLQDKNTRSPDWVSEDKYWELPKKWFNELVDRCLVRYGKIYVVQPYREMEKCAPACMNAVGHECQCSCMGARHGAGNDGSWFEVSDTFAMRWNDAQLACRLMTKR